MNHPPYPQTGFTFKNRRVYTYRIKLTWILPPPRALRYLRNRWKRDQGDKGFLALGLTGTGTFCPKHDLQVESKLYPRVEFLQSNRIPLRGLRDYCISDDQTDVNYICLVSNESIRFPFSAEDGQKSSSDIWSNRRNERICGNGTNLPETPCIWAAALKGSITFALTHGWMYLLRPPQ